MSFLPREVALSALRSGKRPQAAMFSTLTNVNFDDARFGEYLADASAHAARLEAAVRAAGAPPLAAPAVPWFARAPHPFAMLAATPVGAASLGDLRDLGAQVGTTRHLASRTMLSSNTTPFIIHGNTLARRWASASAAR
jgi:hypothetical protein